MSPAAAAQAISAKYNSLGGSGGWLGPAKTQLEADAGTSGFHIDYQGGSIYWSPTSGAYSIGGDIYKKWIAQGGPQSGIGFPITDESSTTDGVCRFSNFEHSGAIYWTAATGAALIYGEIYKKWIAQGGEGSGIGYPITDEVSTPDGLCRFNVFKYSGAIYYTPALGAFLIYGEIYKKWIAQGGEASGIGYPVTDETSTADGVCRYNNFHNGGAIYYTPALGAFLIYGEIYKKWIAQGGEASGIGYPITDETSTADGVCRFNNFHNSGAIYYTPAVGTFLIYGEIYKKWIAQGGETSGIGYPITDETSTPDGVCRFNNFHNGGAIYYTIALGAFLVYGEIYNKWVALGAEQGFLGYPITDETSEGTNGGRFNNFKGGSIHWLPAAGARVVPNAGPLLPLMVPPPTTGLISNFNYFLGDGGNVLTGVSVTIDFDFDFTSSTNGFGFQLNTYSGAASAKLTPTWQQYVIYLEPNNTQLWAMVDNWYGTYPAATDAQLINTEKTFATVSNANTIHAGSQIKITLLNDTAGTITGCVYTYTDPSGNSAATTINLADATVYGTSTKVTAADMAPILALTVNIVGDYNGNAATLTDGEGRISYYCANPLTVLSTEPSYTSFGDGTGESANIIYGGLPAAVGFPQWFGLATRKAGLVPMLKQETRRLWLPPHVALRQRDRAALSLNGVNADGGEL